ncbi:MAG TPA: hypothetical protein VMH92_05700 [Acidocella sp.]|nr:hypothetical protein [Acidocella sp.]
MADSSDVEQALVALVVATLYPAGTSSPSAIAGTPKISVERGWPTEADVRAAVTGSIQLIRIHAIPGMARNAARYEWQWSAPAAPAVTLTATLAANLLTIGGTVTAGEVVAIIIAGQPYSYTALSTDTLDTIAAALVGLVPGASASGAVVNLPDTGTLPSVAVGAPGQATMEVGRQRQVFSVWIWATTPVLRDALFSALQPAIAMALRMTMPDGSTATNKGLQTGGPNDLPARAGTWARDLRVTWEYAIQASMTGGPALIFQTELAPPAASAETVTVSSI